ncbi:hypothetical protein BT96DRAFT_912223 [Gymnopus androsaceus JB14]|uniref:Zn(2)-C6 fungal-type domain-containing protein n=1 Tax=Gymnopus androsaceus JB14 TaxID=1447944 RepID=A0A6A4IMP8_9AGAR|nr:hypothetical protein BT96DRAFT_912223 [Gymnopus androsaceus JB14]
MLAKGPPSRRTSKTLSASQQKAIEEKRLAGLLSCAECRRLKLRCDRTIPCGSCSRRGCSSICPSGVLEAGAAHVHQGGMRVGQLRTKIGIMAGRIRELEAALEKGHSLLDDKLLKIGRADEEPPEDPVRQLDGLGTLTLSENGEANYFGSSGGNESLIAREMMFDSNSDEEDEWEEYNPHPTPELFTAIVGPVVSEEPVNLPSEEDARRLAETYLSHGSLFFRAWKRDEMLDEVLPKLYSSDGASAHLQSAVFFAFAMAVYMNPLLLNGEHEVQAEQCPNEKRNSREDTIRALGLMGTYFSMVTRKHSRDSAWAALGLAAKLCQGAGLHRDPARWNLLPPLVQRRRLLFWEVYHSDISHSIALGRPPTTPLSFVDCEFPDDDGEPDICSLRYQYSRDAYVPIMDLALSAHPTKRSYREILELDAKIRHLPVAKTQPSEDPLKIFYSNQYLNAVMLTLHRSNLAQAILDGTAAAKDGKPFDPFDSTQTPFASSVSAAYHAAEAISRDLYDLAEKHFEYAGRVWFLTYHGFSAGLVLGALASRAPGSTYTPKTLMTLSLVVDGVFAKYAHISARHRTAYLMLRKLRTRAVRQYTAFLEAKAGTRAGSNQSGGDCTVSGRGAPGIGSGIGFGPGAVDPNDPMFHIKLDSDPESEGENGTRNLLENSNNPDTNPVNPLPTFESKVALFGGTKNVLLSLKGKKGKSKKRTKNAEGVSASASPESTTDTNSSQKDYENARSNVATGGSMPSVDTFNALAGASNAMDVFMSDIDIRDLGMGSQFDGMEGVEAGIVMGMALEDIGLSSSGAAGSSGSTTYGGIETQVNPFSAYQQQYGEFPARSSLSPVSPEASSPLQQQQSQETQGSPESLTATAQAAQMYMGMFPYSSNTAADLNMFSSFSQSSTTQSPTSLPTTASSPIPTSTSPPAFMNNPAELYTRFAEFMARKGLGPPPQQQQMPMTNQMSRQNQQGYEYMMNQNNNSYNYGGGTNSNPNPALNSVYSGAPPSTANAEFDADIDAFLRSLQSSGGMGTGIGAGGGGGAGAGTGLPYGQVYGQ